MLADELDLDIAMFDGTFMRVHQHAAGAPSDDVLPTSPAGLRPSRPAEEDPPPNSWH